MLNTTHFYSFVGGMLGSLSAFISRLYNASHCGWTADSQTTASGRPALLLFVNPPSLSVDPLPLFVDPPPLAQCTPTSYSCLHPPSQLLRMVLAPLATHQLFLSAPPVTTPAYGTGTARHPPAIPVCTSRHNCCVWYWHRSP